MPQNPSYDKRIDHGHFAVAALIFILVSAVMFAPHAGASLPPTGTKLVPDAGKNRPLGGPDGQDESYLKRFPLARQERPEAEKDVGDGELTSDDAAKTSNKTCRWQKESENRPRNKAQSGAGTAQAQQSSMANAIGEVARDQGVNAIEFTSKFLANFTQNGNKWNKLRDEVFVPIAVLLLLPGAVLSQVKAIAAAGNPTLEASNPFDGILRSLIGIVLIPATFLVVNYGIDFANAVAQGVAGKYRSLFGKDMYKEAMCAEIRAFTPRHYAENDSSLKLPPFVEKSINNGLFSKIEADWGRLYDPCLGLNLAPKEKDDNAAPQSAIIKRFILNSINATLNITWGILCAFQMAFLYYLFFVGPIMAALWVWPMKLFKDAFPHWVESVLTLCFWTLFWHMTILLMAALKGQDDTGIMIMSALDLLAVMSAKFAFDSVGLAKGAAQTAERLVQKAVSEASQGAGGGGGGKGGKSKSGAKAAARA